MTRFQKIDTKKELINHIVDKLKEIGYREVANSTDGDEDFLMIDTLRKEYIWCENGFYPFCSDDDMYLYEYSETPDSISLKSLDEDRNSLNF